MSQDLQRDAEHLYEAVSHLVRIYQVRDKERICCHEITMSQWSALEHLVEGGPMGLTALAERLMLDKSTASRVVDGLVSKGLAGRVENPEDRRAVRLAARDKGSALYYTIRSSLVEEEERLISDLSPEVRQAAIEVIRRLARSAQHRMIAEGACCVPGAVATEA